ncbi:MAG TPA: MT-A70 family methyltransferase [Rhodothermales bacterium]
MTPSVVRVPIDAIQVRPGRRPLRDVTELVESIHEIGLLNPITVTPDNVLIAGLHRLEACKRLGWTEIPCIVVEMQDVDRELAEIDENLIRHELHYTERAVMLARRKELYEAKHPEAKHGGAPGKAGGGKVAKDETVSSFAADTAARTKVNPRTVQQDVQIAHAFKPQELEVLREADVPKRDALKLARQPEDLREKAVAKIAAGEARYASDAIREVLRDEDAGKVAKVQPLTGKFSVIVIDPPWDYRDVGDEDVAGRSAPAYSRMSIEDIAALPVERLANEDAHLYLWTTNRMLPLSFGLLEKWGFRYITMLTWCKTQLGLGSYFRNTTEHVLFGVRGKLPVLNAQTPTHFVAPRGRHSEKPDAFFELVEKVSPGARLEMFQRRPRPGWTGWGSEAAA